MELETEVKDGGLEIRWPFLKDVRATKPLRCWVTTRDVSEVSNLGSGRAHKIDWRIVDHTGNAIGSR